MWIISTIQHPLLHLIDLAQDTAHAAKSVLPPPAAMNSHNNLQAMALNAASQALHPPPYQAAMPEKVKGGEMMQWGFVISCLCR